MQQSLLLVDSVYFIVILIELFRFFFFQRVNSCPNNSRKSDDLTIEWLNVPGGAFNHSKLKRCRIRKCILIYSRGIDEVLLVAQCASFGCQSRTVIVEILNLDSYCPSGSFGRDLCKTVEKGNDFAPF